MSKPFSEIQEQFRLLHTVMKNDTAYNVVLCVKIDGIVEENRLKTAWSEACRLLPQLGRVLQDEQVHPVSPISETGDISWAHHDVSDDHQAEALIQSLADTPFDLKNEVPVKAVFIKAGAAVSYFLILQHHILVDLQAKELLSRVLSDFYNRGKTDVVFTDYRETFKEEQLKAQKDFWKNALKDAPSSLVLPSSRVLRSAFDGQGQTLFGGLSKNTVGTVRQQEKSGKSQTFLVLLTAYAVMLSRLSGQKDFFIGIPFPNRREPEREFMYGPFVNILPLEVSLKDHESFSSLYGKIRRQMLLLHRNQEIPFLHLTGFYKESRDPKVPFFLQAGFTREAPFCLDLNDLVCSPMAIRPRGAQMDLFVTYWDEGDDIKYRWEFNTRAFSADQILSWKKCWEMLLNHGLEDPDLPLSEWECINPVERKVLEGVFAAGRRNYPVEVPFCEHLTACYSLFAREQAVRDKDTSLSYEEFHDLVRKYAHVFNLRVGTGETIAVVLDNSIDRLGVIHGIVHSGNRYLPIDPNWPRQRIEYILFDSRVKLVVTNRGYGLHLADSRERILVENLKDMDVSGEFSPPGVSASAAIAILYTSGSTGEPKGVSIAGEGITNRLFWMQETFPIGSGDTLVHKVPYTFDVSLWEIFWPFLTGATLYIPDPGIYLNDSLLSNVILEQKITYIHFVPSLLDKFLNNVPSGRFPNLKGIICSGEALEPSLVTRVYKNYSGLPVHNLYGPTEASIDVTSWACSPGEDQIPIGRPIANTRIYILDEEKKLCPPYVRGQIAIAGICLAHGYVNNPEQTNRSFIRGNWGWGEERIYLTGDLGYYHGDAIIEYLGRNDSQIKINGIRIELSEIEKRLESFSSVRSAIVLASEKEVTDTQLSAYIIPLGDVPDGHWIKKGLAEFLPGYMIPGRFFFLDAYPTLLNGKIDKNQLRSLLPRKELPKTDLPVNSGEKNLTYRLTEIWEELLDINNIDVQTSFFDLGGYSQLLPRLKSLMEGRLNTQLELIDFFSHPTIQAQVQLLSSRKEPEEKKEKNSQRQSLARLARRNRNLYQKN